MTTSTLSSLPRRLLRAALWLTGLISALALHAQGTGTVIGRITDARTRLALGGARVAVAGTELATFADASGDYALLNVPAGERTLEVSYVGYSDERQTATVAAGRTTALNFAFGKDIVTLDKFVISGSAVASARAINQQRAAETLSNFIAADEIGRFPDQNAAESMQRVPGLGLYRDQGEGRFIVVRGIRPDLNGVALNGVTMTSPDRGARTVPLDVIPSDALGAVEVTKVYTPDLPAEGLGGRVNLKTRSPFAAEGRQLQFVAQGQYNYLRDRLSSKFNGTFADLFDDGKVGVIFSPTWQARRFGSNNFEVSNPWQLRAVPGAPTTQAFFNQDINYREYEITRTRYGANGAVEFKPDAGTLLYLRATYSYFSDHENRYVSTIPFSEGTVTQLSDTSATVTGVRRENKQLRVRTKTQHLYAFSAGGERTIGDWKLDGLAAFSKGDESKPEDTVIFRKSARGTDWSYSFAPGVYAPVVTQVGGPTIADPAVFNEFNRLRSAPGTGRETELNLAANARRSFDLGGQSAFAKFGGQARWKEKAQDREQVNFTPPASFTFASLSQPQTHDDYPFLIGPRFNAEAVTKTYIDNRSAYPGTRDIASSTQDDWTTQEDVFAAYGMGGVSFGATTLSAGARYERTEFEAKGNDLRTAGSTLTITPGSRARRYDKFLPGVYLRSNLAPKTVLRASWSNTLARPGFADSAFRRSVSDDAKTVTESNPGLKALTAQNWDASLEHYFASLGFVSAAVFYKDIKDFTYQATLPGVTDPATGYSLNTFVNGPKGHISGVELAWQEQFHFLPSPFDGLGAMANLTFSSSSARYLRSATNTFEDAWFIGQSRRIGNVALTYEKYGFFVRASLNYRTPRLREDEPIGASAAEDRYVDTFKQLDLTASYRIDRHWEIFGEVLNLTNEPFRVAFGKERTRFLQFEEYGWSANFGVRWKL